MNYNERDIEHPALIDFIKNHKDIKSILDVGAFYSYNTYANEVRPLVKNYCGVDILPDPITKKILDIYIVGNVMDQTGSYDLVSCISTIEHSGVSTYHKKNYQKEQLEVFKKLLSLSKKYVFITFPFGLPAIHENEFANIDQKQLDSFIKLCGKANVSLKFYFSSAPQQQIMFEKISEDEANKVEYIPELGTRCVCVMEVFK